RVLELGTEARFGPVHLREGRLERRDAVLQHLALVRPPRERLSQPLALRLQLAGARLQLAQVLRVLLGARALLGRDVLGLGGPAAQALELRPRAIDRGLDRGRRATGRARRGLDARCRRAGDRNAARRRAGGGQARLADAHGPRARDALAHRHDAADELARGLL